MKRFASAWNVCVGSRKKDLAEQIMEIARDCGKRWKEPYKSTDIDDFLYDEKGLPK